MSVISASFLKSLLCCLKTHGIYLTSYCMLECIDQMNKFDLSELNNLLEIIVLFKQLAFFGKQAIYCGCFPDDSNLN